MKLFLALTFVMLAAAAFAQPVDRVILVSDTTSVDMLIAKAAGEKTGFPVLILENGTLTDDVRAELSSMGIKIVILVGGPAVIPAETETELGSRYTVIRLWGTERTGTALEVARYFWTDARCAVLADDTKNSEADTELQTDASQIAAADDCPFLPVPKGTVPSEVAKLLDELNVTHATFVGDSSNEFRTKLAHLRRTEITGQQRENTPLELIRNRTKAENATLRLLIIAAPHWRHVLGHSGHAGRHTIIRIVSSTEAVPRLVNLINGNNITDVRVLGHPALAADIVSQLEASSINATKISGARASETAIKALRESMSRWEERRRQAFKDENDVFAKNRMKRQLNSMINNIERELNRLEREVASLRESGANSTALERLQNTIDNSQSQVGIVRDYIQNDNLDTARRRMTTLFSEARKIRWVHRSQLRLDINSDISAEEV